MRIVHFSDPHAGGGAEDLMAYFDKRLVGVFNYSFRRRFRHDLGRFAAGVRYILESRPDLAVCTGDLTSTGQPGEFEKVRRILEPLRNSGVPVVYMPGNHDCYVKREKCVAAVREMFRWLNQDRMDFDDLPLAWDAGEVELLLVNTSAPSNLLCSWGFLTGADREWLLEELRKPRRKPRILVSHYPLLEKHPLLRTRHRLFGQKAVAEALRDGRLDLSLCGHVHRPGRVVDDSGRGENTAGSITLNGTMTEIVYDRDTDRFSYRTVDVDEVR